MCNLKDEATEDLLCYPSISTFGLVDCYTMHNNDCYAFQITWKADHAFRLQTLYNFCEHAKIERGNKLKLFFVSPDNTSHYTAKEKIAYLKGGAEQLNVDLIDAYGNVLLTRELVLEIWDNTEIYCAFPAGDNWINAILTWFRKTSNGIWPPQVLALDALNSGFNSPPPEACKFQYIIFLETVFLTC
jgi:hypothetical protein